MAAFLGAPSPANIVFTRGTTEAINLVAQSWGRRHVGPADEIVISHLEHHANIVPWQQLAAETGAKLKVIPVDDEGRVLLDAYSELLNERTRLVAIAQVSNVLGTIVPVARGDQGGSSVRRHGARRRGAGSRPHGRRRPGDGRGFLRLLRATRCSPRPASVPSTANQSCWRRCRRGKAAGT